MRSTFTAVVLLQQLEDAGIANLDRAMEKFDVSMGFKFSTYSHFWIKAGALDALKEMSAARGISKNLFAPAKQALAMNTALEGQLGRPPTHQELAYAMGVSLERVEELMSVYLPAINLDEQVFEDDDGGTKLDQVAVRMLFHEICTLASTPLRMCPAVHLQGKLAAH